MNITIKSKIPFDEGIYDKAFGLAKSMLLNEGEWNTKIKAYELFVLTAKHEDNSVHVTIKKR